MALPSLMFFGYKEPSTAMAATSTPSMGLAPPYQTTAIGAQA